ncbi:MAG: ABC transporter permease [Treponema sp.]|jgi:ribose transport system permease protein|nr:ABC transporter permease [Treponema sp.]
MKRLNQSSLRRLISLGALLVFFVIFSCTSNSFLNAGNLFAILRNAGIVGIIGVGLTLVIITAGIDLSTGAILAVSCMTMANCYRYTSLPVWSILAAGVLVGLLCGVVNGLAVTRLRLPEFIATLATQGIFRGLTYMTAIRVNGNITNQPIRDYRFTLLAEHTGGVYYVTIVWIALALIGQVVLKRTRFGTAVYAAGTDPKAAGFSGINTSRIRLMVFAITGFCCGIGALFMSARMQTATADFGFGLEFDVIAAVVVGGCALNGGRGDVIGSLIGAVFMAMLDNGIYKYQINTSYQPIIKGAIIVLVVIFDAWYRGYMDRRLQLQRAGGEPPAARMLAAQGPAKRG